MNMIADTDLGSTLRGLKEGDLFFAGTLLRGVSHEAIAWKIFEKVAEGDDLRVTMHAYWHEIFIVSKVVRVMPNDILTWGATKT